jgi:ATP-dependent protease ClpP protease subunit
MKALGVFGLLMTLLLIPPLVSSFRSNSALTRQIVNGTNKTETVPKLAEDALDNETELKVVGVEKTLLLEARNTVVLRGPVTIDSVSRTMLQLKKISKKLPKTTPIYLVLDTPGGSIMDGLDLIDFANALPQKVHTVTLFAASMGFQIAQNLDRRYIIRNGILMSHRASVSGLSGQVKGELESRYKMVRRAVDYLDFQAAKRMGMDLNKYEAMVVNEYWIYGYDAVADKAADEEVLVQCGESLTGTEDLSFQTMFGEMTATVSKCPLIKGAVSIDASQLYDKADVQEATEILLMSLENKRVFIKEYIVTGKFVEIFR